MNTKILTFIFFLLSNFSLNAQYQSRIISEVNSDNARANTLKYDDGNLLACSISLY